MSDTPHPFIIVVEDEEHISKLVARHLEEAGMRTQIYNSAAPALRFLKKNFANLLLLDVNLPDQSGFELLTELHQNDIYIPTIFLTGNSLELDKLRGLELADDYVTKPFSYTELVARIYAVLRRAEIKADLHLTNNVSVTDETFDFCRARVTPTRLEIAFPDGDVEKIGRKEIGILACLHANRGTVLTRKVLIHAVWGLHADVTSRSVDQYVVKLRELFRQHHAKLDQLHTVHGVGYLYDPEGVTKA
jgi:DNA-binding response OmpR family regulator